jgi:hypothetical protein
VLTCRKCRRAAPFELCGVSRMAFCDHSLGTNLASLRVPPLAVAMGHHRSQPAVLACRIRSSAQKLPVLRACAGHFWYSSRCHAPPVRGLVSHTLPRNRRLVSSAAFSQ